MMTEMAPGTVTIADLFRVLTDMRSDIGKALEKLAVIDSRNQNADSVHADHESRLRALAETRAPKTDVEALERRVTALERVRYKLTGAAALGGLVAGVGGSWIGFLISHHH